MIIEHYTFVGCISALEFHIKKSSFSDKQQAIDACADLVSVGENIMQECAGNNSDEKACEIFSKHVVTILGAIEQLRITSLFEGLDSTLIDLLDHFYNTADSIMGGGGASTYSGWPGSDGGGSIWWGSGSGSGSGAGGM